jgi:hypothetical protein
MRGMAASKTGERRATSDEGQSEDRRQATGTRSLAASPGVLASRHSALPSWPCGILAILASWHPGILVA